MEISSNLKRQDSISVAELQRLLHEIKDHKLPIGIRYRTLGQMWQNHYFKVFLVTTTGTVLIDQKTNKTEIVSNISDIIQFELDSRFQIYEPNHHYTVSLNE
jgi:hypothetical protein